MKGPTFQNIHINNPETLLINLCNLLKIEGDWEMSINCLKQILIVLEKYEKQYKALPLSAVRQSGLITLLGEKIKININTDKFTLELAKWSLSVMIQISYLSPNEFSSQ